MRFFNPVLAPISSFQHHIYKPVVIIKSLNEETLSPSSKYIISVNSASKFVQEKYPLFYIFASGNYNID